VGETYWPDADPTLAGGCVLTGDLAEVRDGQVRLIGRLGDLINVAGRKVSPETIERVLGEHPAVRECLVCSVPAADAGRGEDILAVVVPAGPLSATPLRDWLAQRLPAWQVPRKWRFVDALPVNERGKVARAELSRRAVSGGEPPSHHDPPNPPGSDGRP
jgi:long-chain acyl-CoA synthetase